MADLNSDSSGSSGENSGNSNSSDKSKASRKSRTLWTENWTSKPKTGQDGRVLGRGDAYYEHLVDKQSAKRAVAIVVNTASKHGYVPLCTEFASLLRDNKRMEVEINRLRFIITQMKKKNIDANQSKQIYSSSTSESGSGGSGGLKAKNTQVTQIPATLSPSTQHNSSTSMSVEAPSKRHDNEQTDSPQEEHQLTVEEELQKAKKHILKLENQISYLKAEIQLLKGQAKHALQIPSPKASPSERTRNKTNKSTQDKPRTSPETLPVSTSLNAKETINTKADKLKHNEQNCCLKSCVKHRTKNGPRTLAPYRTHLKPSPDQVIPLDDTTSACNVMPLQLQNNNDKKLLEIKPNVLPKLGDYVTVQGEIKGYVNYVGPVKGETSDFVGIQLPSPVGNSDGSLDGVKLFSCPPNYGAFVLLKDVQTVEPRSPAQLYGQQF